MTSKDRKIIQKTPNKVMKGVRLANPAGIITRYRKRIKSLLKRMRLETVKEINKLFNSDASDEFFEKQDLKATTDESIASKARILTNALLKKYTALFNDKSWLYAEEMVTQVNITSNKSVRRSLDVLTGGLAIKGSLTSIGNADINKALIAENVALIKSIPADYMDRVRGKVMRSIALGDLQQLNVSLSKSGAISERRVKNMADDQVRKSFNAVNKERLLNVGIKKFQWLHSGGGQKPRQDHIDMDGEIFSFDDLPIIDNRTGERGIPGQAINCRCTMNPIIDFEDD